MSALTSCSQRTAPTRLLGPTRSAIAVKALAVLLAQGA
jgi:hypothetical protein